MKTELWLALMVPILALSAGTNSVTAPTEETSSKAPPPGASNVPKAPAVTPGAPGNQAGAAPGATADTITLDSGRVVTYTGIAGAGMDIITFITPTGSVLIATASLPSDLQNAIEVTKWRGKEVRGQIGKLNADGIFVRDVKYKAEPAKSNVPEGKRMPRHAEADWIWLNGGQEIFVLGGHPDVTAGVANRSDWKGYIYPAGSYIVHRPTPQNPTHTTTRSCYAQTPEEAALWARNHPSE